MVIVSKRLVLTMLVGGLVVSLAGATPSIASQPDAGSAEPATTSPYLAGFRESDPEHVSAVIIKAVDVPDVTCDGPGFAGVGLGGGSEPVLGEVEYFAGVYLTCSSGQAQYLMDVRIGDEDQGTGIEPGDRAQIVITLQCDVYPTCDVFANATSLDTDTSVSIEGTIDVTTDSAVFGAFPMFAEGKSQPAPVPGFRRARIVGCLFDNHLIGKDAERLKRVRQGHLELRPSRIRSGSFVLRQPGIPPARPSRYDGGGGRP